MPALKTAASCWRRAAEAETQAAQISDQHLKAVYQRIAHQWSGLARSYEFADSAKFSLGREADQERECATGHQRIGPLTVVAREWRSQALPAGPFRWRRAGDSADAGRTARSRSRLAPGQRERDCQLNDLLLWGGP